MNVLSVGEDPTTVDYSNTPDGVDEASIRTGIDKALADMKAQGWIAWMCLVPPDIEPALANFKQMLAVETFDVILFGGGLRMPPARIALFEALMNEAHRSAPQARSHSTTKRTRGRTRSPVF